MSFVSTVVRRAGPALCAGACFLTAALRGAEATPEWAAVKEQTFQTVWQTVNESYFDRNFGGVNWAGMRESYRERVVAAEDKPALRGVLQEMLGELGKSHFAILPREAAAMEAGERARVGTMGAEFAVIEGEVVVARVRPGSGALAAGLRPGDAVLRVDDKEVAQVAAAIATSGLTPARQAAHLAAVVAGRLRVPVGTAVSLVVSAPGGEVRGVVVTSAAAAGVWSEPIGNFPPQLMESVTERGDDGIAYLRFNVFVPALMKPIRALLKKLQPGDGLVIDLRGNAGGLTPMAQGICGWLLKTEVSLGKTEMRQGFVGLVASPQDGAFLGPVAVLIDSGSASASEILAAGLQEAKRARIFGATSAGAVLPSSFKPLPTGDLLQYAVADFVTPKRTRLEGRGVIPDEPVTVSRVELSEGRDPVLAAARSWLALERKKDALAPRVK